MNIYDIAQQAGVSIATVSRVLNGSDKVRESTRSAVEEVLKENQYTPSVFARGMVSGTMRTVGVLTIDVRDLYFGTVTYAIEQAFFEAGYNTVLCNTGGLPDQQLHYLALLAARQADGIILVGSAFDDETLEAAILETSAKIPVVMLNRSLEGPNIWSVICDEEEGVAQCVDHLCDNGHRRIVYIKDTNTYSASRKLAGFRRGMAARNLTLSPESIIETDKGLQGGIDAVNRLIEQGADFSALITGDDVTAAGVCKALRAAGRRPGFETAVSGFNDSIIALSTEPELTSVDNRPRLMGETAVEVLSQVLAGTSPPPITIVQPQLIVRTSTRGAKPA